MEKLNLPFILLIFAFFASLVMAGFFTYKLYKTGRLDILVSEKISVFSEVEGIEAEIGNKSELEALLIYFEFWQGATPDNLDIPRNS